MVWSKRGFHKIIIDINIDDLKDIVVQFIR